MQLGDGLTIDDVRNLNSDNVCSIVPNGDVRDASYKLRCRPFANCITLASSKSQKDFDMNTHGSIDHQMKYFQR
jgi:hypothetical protein